MAFIPEVQTVSATTDLDDGGEPSVERLKGNMASYSEHFE